MRKLWKRVLSLAIAAAMTLGSMTIGVGALEYRSDAEDYGQLVQSVVNYNYGLNGLCVVQLVPIGSTIEFSEEVTIAIYAEDGQGQYAPQAIGSGASYTVNDSLHTYVFAAADGSICMFRGAASYTPMTIVGDHERNFTLKLSQPVVRVSIQPLTRQHYNYDTGAYEYEKGDYLVFEVAEGTTISPGNGYTSGMSLGTVWDRKGKVLDGEARAALIAEQFPEAQTSFMGTPLCPVTLNEAGCFYQFQPEAIACTPPIFRVVEDKAPVYEPRAAAFPDMGVMSWSAPFVEKAYGCGWMDGMEDGTFRPASNLTIAQAITLAARIHSTQYNCPIPYSQGPWYQSYFDYCRDNGLLSYYDPDQLLARINQNATRLDMVKILDGAANVSSAWESELHNGYVPDVNEYEDDGGYVVYKWYRAGIVAGDAGTHAFRPGDEITRGEVAVILCQLLGL